MKLKENNDKISLKILPVIFALSFVAATIVRTVQYFGFIDHVTGFSTGLLICPGVLLWIITTILCAKKITLTRCRNSLQSIF